MSQIESGGQYYERQFRGLQMEGISLRGAEFGDCLLEGCRAPEGRFTACRWVDSIFRDCDLSLVDFSGSTFSGVRFENCKLVGVNWTLADWDHVRLDGRLTFKDCNLNHSTFIGLKLHQLKIVDCQAADLDFRGAELRGADFSGSDLSGCLFGETDLRQADFSRARNYALSPVENKLDGAAFSLPEALSLLYAMNIRLGDD